jgi:hypothetical protein
MVLRRGLSAAITRVISRTSSSQAAKSSVVPPSIPLPSQLEVQEVEAACGPVSDPLHISKLHALLNTKVKHAVSSNKPSPSEHAVRDCVLVCKCFAV